MSKDDDAERKLFGGIVPARPKGASGPTPPPPLDNLLKQRRQTMQGPARLDFDEKEDPKLEEPPPTVSSDPLQAFAAIARVLRPLSKTQRKLVISTFADILD